MDGIVSVIKKLATFPRVIEPYSLLNHIAHAPFNVAALIASAGIRRILIQPRETINFISPDGVEPGL